MQTNILWTGEGCHSLENCVLTVTDTGAVAQSTIVGMDEGILYKAEYTIQVNQNWQTVLCSLRARIADNVLDTVFESDGQGNWKRDGLYVPEFNGCIDVDLPLTPFTNTLPIRRLQLSIGETHTISVVYLDILQQAIRPVQQQYRRLSEHEYQYENVPNDFEAVILTDDAGLVVNYPGLFKRTAKVPSHYSAEQIEI